MRIMSFLKKIQIKTTIIKLSLLLKGPAKKFGKFYTRKVFENCSIREY